MGLVCRYTNPTCTYTYTDCDLPQCTEYVHTVRMCVSLAVVCSRCDTTFPPSHPTPKLTPYTSPPNQYILLYLLCSFTSEEESSFQFKTLETPQLSAGATTLASLLPLTTMAQHLGSCTLMMGFPSSPHSKPRAGEWGYISCT